MHPRFATAFSFLALTLAGASHPVWAQAEAGAAPAAMPVREAGARYGQALGTVEICFGAKITAKAEELPKTYTGADGETFKAQAGKILDAWLKVKTCVRQDDPNQCKIIMDKSCQAAEAEIGSNGSAIPGLVEFAKH